MKLIGNSNRLIRVPYSLFSINKTDNKFSFIYYNQIFSPTMTTTKQIKYSIGLDQFCYRQFDRNGPSYIPYPKEKFLEKVFLILLFFFKVREAHNSGIPLKDGYAPFCKHIYLKNFTDALSSSIPITPENQHLLRTGYLNRTSNELPVLCRWFRKSDVQDQIKKAKYLDVILYSGEQVIKEYTAMGTLGDQVFDLDYYIISVKPQDVEHELPMQPITMMRNALIKEGGSGVSIDYDKYQKSVEYWSNHAVFMDE